MFAGPKAVIYTPREEYLDSRPDCSVGVVFIASLFLSSTVATYLLWITLPITASNILTGAIWTLGFYVLSLNTSFMLLTALISWFAPCATLPDVPAGRLAPCDLVFVVKDEPAEVLANMEASLKSNLRAGIRLVLISNSTNPETLECEQRVITNLQSRYGQAYALHWRPLNNPSGRKHTALHQFFCAGPGEKYCFLCDADTIVPSGAIDRLIRKAEHGANSDIAVFQALVRIGQTSTRFARLFQFGVELSQRVHMVAMQRIFGCVPFFGHGALIKRDVFKCIRLPPAVLSHDIWEMALLSRQGHRVAFCPDVCTYEEFPSQYLEVLRRDRRWAEGTLQSARVLSFRGLSLAARFFVTHAVYGYLSQLVFFLLAAIGLLYECLRPSDSIVTHPTTFILRSWINCAGRWLNVLACAVSRLVAPAAPVPKP